MSKNVSGVNLNVEKVGRLVFGWLDYCLFTGLLGLSLLIGVYFGFFSKQNSTVEYLYGGKSMHYFPVAVSILASFLSGITFLGVPTEVYQHGSQYYATVISILIIGLASAYIAMPVFHKLQVRSCFEYLELRFSRRIRTFSSILYIIGLFLFIPVVVYVPAIAFSQVTGFSVHGITPILCTICITYTSMGGIKSVVWTDFIQFFFTVGGLVAVLTLGVLSVGSITEMWNIADKGGRVKFFDLDTNITRKDTFWTLTVGFTFAMYSRLGLGQKFIQRYLAVEKESDMKKAIFITTLGWAVIQISCVFTGLLMYAKYYECDPLKAKLINRADQILPFYVMDVASHVSGLPGIFLAGLVSSALSTMSASLNTQSGIIYDTFIDRYIQESPHKDALAANIMKVISVIVGIVTICLIFVIERLGTIFEMAIGLASVSEGTLLGLFLAGLLLPWIGKKGAMTGACVSFVTMVWIVAGSQYYTMRGKIHYHPLPTSIEGCPASANQTGVSQIAISANNQTVSDEDEPFIVYKVSVLYFTLIGSLIVIVIGGISSYFFGEIDLTNVNSDHVSTIVRRYIPAKKSYTEVPLKENKRKKTKLTESNEKMYKQNT